MTWKKNEPAGTRQIRSSDELIRDNWDHLEDALARNHQFPDTYGDDSGEHTVVHLHDRDGNGGAPSQPTETNKGVVYNWQGDLYLKREGASEKQLGPIPSGTKMFFKEAAAPTGWTFKAEDNDRALINTSTEADGGTTGGSWTISGWSFSVDGHVLTESEMPSHKHGVPWGENTSVFSPPWGMYDTSNDHMGTGQNDVDNSFPYSEPKGGDSAHSHGFTSSHDGSWRPKYVAIITCEKD